MELLKLAAACIFIKQAEPLVAEVQDYSPTELEVLLQQIIDAANQRKKDFAGTNILGLLSTAFMNPANPISLLAALPASALAIVPAKAHDKKLRQELIEKLGPERGEEIANLSQLVYNKGRTPVGRAFPYGLGIYTHIGEKTRRKKAAKALLEKLLLQEVDPAKYVSPYSWEGM